MRLIKIEEGGKLSLVKYHDEEKFHRYAILSHTWGADEEEITYENILEGTGKDKVGYKKIEFCVKQAARDGLEHFWVDTCCIIQSSSTELSEAINSMFRWYQKAFKCYVYLSDVSTSDYVSNEHLSLTEWEAVFRNSRWFTRGWTLQELIAPVSVEFFTTESTLLGSKASLEQVIHDITGIAIEALRGGPLTEFAVEKRLAWAKHRETKCPEDKAYSLLGLFNIHMPLIYGEGGKKAYDRLLRKIGKSLNPTVQSTETLPLPLSTVPFRRDVDFVDRRTLHHSGTLLEQIQQRCAATTPRIALVGIGGAGKSQLAIEYCYRLRERSPKTWVFWIHASNLDRIEQGYRDIAERVKIPSHDDEKVNIFELVTRWLRDGLNGTWLLVLDNLDDNAVLQTPQAAAQRTGEASRDSPPRRSLLAHIPQSQNGAVLITTRTRSVATRLVEPRDIIPVDSMTSTDAITLFKRKSETSTDDSDLQELIDLLESIPLAIVQAAAYIQQKGARYSVRQYIETFQKSEKQQTSLLNYEAGSLRRDSEAKNSVIITWQISFNDIRERWSLSANLLSLMSYFDRQGIPAQVLKIQLEAEGIQNSMKQQGDSIRNDKEDQDEDTTDGSASEENSDYAFEEAVERLQSYSFVSIREDGQTFEMHRLVQLATRKWLEMRGEDKKWKSQFCRKLNAVFPTGKHENWALCKMLFPHAKSAERQRPMDNQSLQEWAQILRNAAWYARARGDYPEAERMCEKSARALARVCSRDNSETLYSLGLLALIYCNQGRWIEAEKLQLQAMETRRRVLGEEHPDTLTSISNLASTYWNQGRWTEAEKLELQAMETRRRVLGKEHPHTLTSISNLASTYMDQGRWTEAEKLQVEVMETRRRVQGEEHPHTLTSISNLASTYWNQGRWTEAEKLQLQAIETRRRVLGEEHPDTLTSMNNLAIIMEGQGRKTEAIKLMAECVQLLNRVLGTEHPKTLSATVTLAKWQGVDG